MSKRPRRNHSAGFKAKVALAAVKGDRHGLCAHGDRGKLLGVICRASPCVRPLKACTYIGCMCCQLSYDLKRMLHPVSP